MPKRKIDAIDRKILQAIQRDGKITTHELAEKINLSASPCARRIRLMEDAGIIKGYAAIIDEKRVGLAVSVFASIKLERQSEENLNKFEKAVSLWPEVVDCYLMTGQRDYLMRLVMPDLDAYETFIKTKLTRLDNIASIESSFALGQVKRSVVMPMGDG